MKDNLMISALDHCKTQMNDRTPAVRSRSTLRTVTAGVTAMAISLLGTTQAMAETANAVRPAAAAPNCVHSSGTGRTVTVTNTCSTTQRVKVIFAFAQDGACFTYRPGQSVRWTGALLARFDGLVRC